MATTYYFLDTEWADVTGGELVSLALVNEGGDRLFYAERANLPEAPTDFVRQSVYPLLDRGDAALPDAALTTELRAFLSETDAPAVMADLPNDLQLLRYALDGFELPDDQVAACGPRPAPVMTRMSKEGLPGLLVEDWFAAHPEHSPDATMRWWTRRLCGWLAWWRPTASLLRRGPTPTAAPGDSGMASIPGMLAP